jgi:hypothetical protein
LSMDIRILLAAALLVVTALQVLAVSPAVP